MTDPNQGRDKAVEPTVVVTQEELAAFGELLDNIQQFLMSLDLRLRHIEAMIYAAGQEQEEAEILELPTGPGPDSDPLG